MNLVDCPHLGLKATNTGSDFLIRGPLKYYHYACDNFDDKGWGCGYRTLQSILSWIQANQKSSDGSAMHTSTSVPSILDIQTALVAMEDKTESFIGSRQWIGSVEVAYCIEYFHKVQCKIIHLRDINDLKQYVDDIAMHFKEFGSPIMMGGDRDCSSKGILGINISPDNIKLLILDPHYTGHSTSREKLQANGWVKWIEVDSLDHSSFYNLCCPLIKADD